MNQTLDEMRSYIGRRVIISLDDHPDATVTGVLRSVADDGEAEYLDDFTSVPEIRWCWPALTITPV